jgi:hypothetical protein
VAAARVEYAGTTKDGMDGRQYCTHGGPRVRLTTFKGDTRSNVAAADGLASAVAKCVTSADIAHATDARIRT